MATLYRAIVNLTKTVSGHGEKFLQETIANHTRDGWKVDHVTRATLGKFTVVFSREDTEPPRPD
jgi:hypothetical protein